MKRVYSKFVNLTFWKVTTRVQYIYINSTLPTLLLLKSLALVNFSRFIVIRVNLLHPLPSLFLYGLLLSLWCFSILVNYYFQVFFNLEVILYVAKITQKNHDWAPLTCLISFGIVQIKKFLIKWKPKSTHQHVISQSLQLLSNFVIRCDRLFIWDFKSVPLGFEFFKFYKIKTEELNL